MKTWLRASTAITFLPLFSAIVPSSFAQSGYFRVENRAGVWWLLDPNGSTTLSIGVDTIRYEGDRIQGTRAAPYLEAVKKLYPDRASWGQAVLARLRSWGFNTIGAWSDPELWDLEMPYTIILDIAERAGADWQHGRPADVFDPQFEDAARKIGQEQCAARAKSRFLVGYFSDNELRWGLDWRGKETMLTMLTCGTRGNPGVASLLVSVDECRCVDGVDAAISQTLGHGVDSSLILHNFPRLPATSHFCKSSRGLDRASF